ncbi:AAA family ATPase [Pedobacter cryoconitis]|uniref:AAA family ATPase n=1 Tax=Pedobacter cryoconitis TaxID=188932 RepID=UPI001620F869|nr:AAA family ATPase [Pedobacter cryoconitis]MBB5646366.1 putative ATPase [Pedobacter cryoconitis]
MTSPAPKYIISGGPGSGKTTLINGLQQQGYFCSEEISRKMIIQETAKGSFCLPWIDISCFSAKVLQEMIFAWNQAPTAAITFFDRAIPDIIAYLNVAEVPVPEEYYTALALHPYHKQVFIMPPWESIYVNDSERWQTFEEAVIINEAIRKAYTTCGFELIDVPKNSQTERVAFILDFI